jgi:hypothetical protein
MSVLCQGIDHFFLTLQMEESGNGRRAVKSSSMKSSVGSEGDMKLLKEETERPLQIQRERVTSLFNSIN